MYPPVSLLHMGLTMFYFGAGSLPTWVVFWLESTNESSRYQYEHSCKVLLFLKPAHLPGSLPIKYWMAMNGILRVFLKNEFEYTVTTMKCPHRWPQWPSWLCVAGPWWGPPFTYHQTPCVPWPLNPYFGPWRGWVFLIGGILYHAWENQDNLLAFSEPCIS